MDAATAAGNKEDQKPEARTDGNGDQVRNLNEASTLASLRGAQHKDANGNLIGMYPPRHQLQPPANVRLQRTPIFQTQRDRALKDR